MKSLAAITHLLAQYRPTELAMTNLTAAVMVVLLQSDASELEIVITERAHTLPSYAGHYSFPGGMHDATDTDLYMTAQRELFEELAIPFDAYTKLGQLNDFSDRYGNLVRPFVVVMPKTIFLQQAKMSIAEINSIYFLPALQLNQFKDNPDLYKITHRRPSYSYTFDEVFIWGLTAAILVHFSHLVTAAE